MDNNDIFWEWAVKLGGMTFIVLAMLAIAHGLSLGMTHMLSTAFTRMLPTP